MSYAAAIDWIRRDYYVARWLDERVRSHVRHGYGRAETTAALAARRDRHDAVVDARVAIVADAFGVAREVVMRDVRPW